MPHPLRGFKRYVTCLSKMWHSSLRRNLTTTRSLWCCGALKTIQNQLEYSAEQDGWKCFGAPDLSGSEGALHLHA